jgi:hypothetical protein
MQIFSGSKTPLQRSDKKSPSEHSLHLRLLRLQARRAHNHEGGEGSLIHKQANRLADKVALPNP